MIRIAILASGSGTNAENIIKYFKNHVNIKVSMVLTNNAKAKVIDRAKKLDITSIVFSREDFYDTNFVLNVLKKNADFIVLAGFLWKVPEFILNEFSNKIINIHPALLPKYGGKGMYGMHVHKAVVENKEKESGITIHYVNKNYDEGNIIFQEKFEVLESDSAESVAQKIHILEQDNFPKVIEKVILKNG
ncbi:MAG: phosphoribosylglycinamide formyltransferase [Lutibacter sp.]|uniref:phosphoribosylglycinamide formyltransferase n=1 Tax=Lutibacter sp. TaxID=1925666 RepID=UPI00299CFA75|nr:phosphoribosylglycinamide formyltransferase [Lutibacter sp.]MDX1830055.1 phosphoribosylglycinamide formyltransferase [Lutibacter sp.]